MFVDVDSRVQVRIPACNVNSMSRRQCSV